MTDPEDQNQLILCQVDAREGGALRLRGVRQPGMRDDDELEALDGRGGVVPLQLRLETRLLVVPGAHLRRGPDAGTADGRRHLEWELVEKLTASPGSAARS